MVRRNDTVELGNAKILASLSRPMCDTVGLLPSTSAGAASRLRPSGPLVLPLPSL